MLLNLNLDSKLSGYKYLKYAIEIMMADKWYYANKWSIRLYPDIAKKFAVTTTRVKMALAYAIKKSGSKKTAGRFISDIVERLEDEDEDN